MRPTSVSISIAAILVAAGAASAVPVLPGNIVLYRVGDGTGTLVNTGSAVFIDEFYPNGTLRQSIPMPTVAGGGNNQLIASGTATSEGLLSVSPDGQYVALTGYARNLGGAGSLASTTGAVVPRTVGILSTATGLVNTSTALTDFASGNNPRSATTTNGTDIWAAGGAGGIRATTIGSTTSNDLTTGAAFTNVRQVNVFDGQLYASSGSGTNTFRGVETVGSGTPTSGAQTVTRLPGLSDTSNPSAYGFFFADLDAGVAGLDTLWVADDAAGAISKFSLVAGSWVPNGIVGADADDYRGLTGYVSPTGVQLFATRKGGGGATGGGELVSLFDGSGYNGALTGTPTLLATASLNTAYRGVGYVIPSPASATLMAIGSLLVARRRRA